MNKQAYLKMMGLGMFKAASEDEDKVEDLAQDLKNIVGREHVVKAPAEGIYKLLDLILRQLSVTTDPNRRAYLNKKKQALLKYKVVK